MIIFLVQKQSNKLNEFLLVEDETPLDNFQVHANILGASSPSSPI